MLLKFQDEVDLGATLLGTTDNPRPSSISEEPETTPPLEENVNVDFDALNAGLGENLSEDARTERISKPESMQLRTSEVELAAICRIQRWYNKMRRRRSESESGDLTLLLLYTSCAANLPHVSRPALENHHRFSAVARGFYPHALAVLERLMLMLGIVKKGLKQRLRKAVHLELDNLQESITITK